MSRPPPGHLPVLLAAGVAFSSWSCFGGGPGSSGEACSPPEQLSSDVLAAAYRDHPPTLDERKAAAVLWVTAAMTAESGGRPADAFVISDLGDRLRDLAEAYPSVSACAGAPQEPTSGAVHSVASALSSCSEFACDTSCWPDVSVFGPAAGPALTLLKKIGAKLVPPAQPTGEEPPVDWNALYLKLHKTTLGLVFDSKGGVTSISKRIGDALANGLSEDDVKAIEKIVSAVVSSTEEIAKAAAKAGVANAALIAEVCSGVEAALLAKQFADGLEPARQLVADCWLFKSRYCGAKPFCSNPDPCAKLIGNACVSDVVRAPDGAADVPFAPVGCLDPSNPGGCPHPSRDGGPIEGDGGMSDGGARDGGSFDAGSREGGIDAGSPEGGIDAGSDGGGVRRDGGTDAGDTICCCNFDVNSNGGEWICVHAQEPSPALCYTPWPDCCSAPYTVCP